MKTHVHPLINTCNQPVTDSWISRLEGEDKKYHGSVYMILYMHEYHETKVM